MVLPIHTSLQGTRRLGRVALTALVIGLGGAAIATIPLGNLAFAGNGGGKGGGNGGGNGGGHGHDGGKGGGNGGGNGNSGGGQGKSHDGQGSSAKADKSGDDESTTASSDDSTTDDGSMSASKLGKLNGFFHASSNGLANASPNSAIGRISHTFKDALSAYAEANEDTDTETDPEDPNATPPTGPSIDDLGAILAGATNKKVTATQVQAIIDRLAEENPDDDALNDLADSADDETAQDIADAANGESPDDSDDADDESADTSTDDGTSDGTDTTVTTTATN